MAKLIKVLNVVSKLHSCNSTNLSLRVWRRTLLSPAYSCPEAWNKRLDNPVMKALGAYDLSLRLQERLDKEGKVAAVDMDILANKFHELDGDQLDFAQNLFKRFRKTRECQRITASTPFALIQNLLHKKETARIMEILSDKLSYGIFLDDSMANMLLDYFMENNLVPEAAQVAYDQMLQEDLTQPLKGHLCWLAAHQRWRQLQQATEAGEEEDGSSQDHQEEEEEEEVMLRVDFLSTPFYDDHFDLYKEPLKLGKTLVMVAKQQGAADSLCLSYKLIGYGLFEKFDLGLELLEEILRSDGLSLAQDALDDFKMRLEDIETKEKPEPKDMGEMKMVDVYPYVTKEEKARYQAQLEEISQRLRPKLDPAIDLDAALTDKVQRVVADQQDADIPRLTARFTEWEELRDQLLDEQKRAYELQARKEAVARKLQELQEREEKLRFFEETDRVALGITNAPQRKQREEHVAEEVFVLPPGERKGRDV